MLTRLAGEYTGYILDDSLPVYLFRGRLYGRLNDVIMAEINDFVYWHIMTMILDDETFLKRTKEL